ncbi:hypothetical protein LTR95_015009 [Oleoguttula sp. CCFEE 5521]
MQRSTGRGLSGERRPFPIYKPEHRSHVGQSAWDNDPGSEDATLDGTRDAEQGVVVMRLIGVDVTIWIRSYDCDVFLSPLEDLQKAVDRENLGKKLMYLDRGEELRFEVR